MGQRAPIGAENASGSGYEVELPRESDAIGCVLRDAYARDLGLPDDMLALLRKMGSRPATSRDF